eukprot:745508-Hanusia_phi.AAC.1
MEEVKLQDSLPLFQSLLCNAVPNGFALLTRDWGIGERHAPRAFDFLYSPRLGISSLLSLWFLRLQPSKTGTSCSGRQNQLSASAANVSAGNPSIRRLPDAFWGNPRGLVCG